MNTTRRNVFKGLAAAGAMPLFNIGCAGFGMSRARQIAKGAKIRVALIGCGARRSAANAYLKTSYRNGWEV